MFTVPSAPFVYKMCLHSIYIIGTSPVLCMRRLCSFRPESGEEYFEVVRCTANVFFVGNRNRCIAATVVGTGVEHSTIQT